MIIKSLANKNEYFIKSILPFILLIAFLILLSFHVFRSIDFTITGDKYQAFNFARDLSNGRFYQEIPLIHLFPDVLPQNAEVPTGHLGTLYYKGRIFSKMEIGFPLILSVFYTLFGTKSFFYVCQIFLIAFLFVYYYFIAQLFRRHRLNSYIALISVVAVGALPNTIIFVSGHQFRDIPALFFLFAALLFFFKSFQEDEKYPLVYMYFSAFIFGISCIIRVTNIIFILPIGIHFLLNIRKKIPIKNTLIPLIVCFFLFNIALVPLYFQNIKTTGKIYLPPQHSEGQTIFNIKGEEKADPIFANHTSLRFFIPKLPKICAFFKQVYSVPGIMFIAAGIIASCVYFRRYLFLIISSITAILFFGTYGKYFWARYMLFSHPFIAPLFSFGIFSFIDFVNKLTGRNITKYGKTEVTFVVIVFSLVIYLTIPPVLKKKDANKVYNIDKEFFHYADIPSFKAVFEKYIPQDGVLLASYRLYENVDFYCNFRSTDPVQVLLWKGNDFKFGYGRILDHNIPLFFIGNAGFNDGRKLVPLIKEHFEMIPIATLSAKEARLRRKHHFGLKECTLYKIERWKDEEIVLMLENPQNADSLLTLNMRQIFDDNLPHKAEIKLGGAVISESLRNGINYFKLPASLFYGDQTRFVISADVPMPADILISNEPMPSCIFFNLGDRSERTISITKGMKSQNTAFRSLRKYNEPAYIRIPVITGDDFAIGIKLTTRVLNLPENIKRNLKINFSLDGNTLDSAELITNRQWQTLFTIVPRDIIKSQTADLSISIDAEDCEIIKKYGIEPFLEFNSLKVEQWGKKISSTVLLSRNETQFHRLIAFEATGMPTQGKYNNLQVEMGGNKCNINTSNGINWIFLPSSLFSIRGEGLNVSIINPDEEAGFLRWAGNVSLIEPFEIDVFPDDTPFVVSGFLNREQPADSEVKLNRWTDGNAIINIPSLYDDGMIIEIYVEPLPKTLSGMKTSVTWNGKEIGNIITSSESTNSYRFEISAEMLTPNFIIGNGDSTEKNGFQLKPVKFGNNILCLKTPTWKPFEKTGIPDTRDLGIQIRKIIVKRK